MLQWGTARAQSADCPARRNSQAACRAESRHARGGCKPFFDPLASRLQPHYDCTHVVPHRPASGCMPARSPGAQHSRGRACLQHGDQRRARAPRERQPALAAAAGAAVRAGQRRAAGHLPRTLRTCVTHATARGRARLGVSKAAEPAGLHDCRRIAVSCSLCRVRLQCLAPAADHSCHFAQEAAQASGHRLHMTEERGRKALTLTLTHTGARCRAAQGAPAR